MKPADRQQMMRDIERHGRDLLAIFPDAVERDPVTLCRRLRRFEAKVRRAAEALCNGEEEQAYFDAMGDGVRVDVNNLLGTDRVWINGDPRGYALKISLRDGEQLHRDWGGYGIIAPDLTPND